MWVLKGALKYVRVFFALYLLQLSFFSNSLMPENSFLLLYWKKRGQDEIIDRVVVREGRSVKSWIKLNLKSLLLGQFCFDFIALSQSPTSWKGLGLTLVLRFLLDGCSASRLNSWGQREKPLYGSQILSQKWGFYFLEKRRRNKLLEMISL